MDPRSEQTLLKKTYRWSVATQKDALYHTDHQGEANQFRNSSAQIRIQWAFNKDANRIK